MSSYLHYLTLPVMACIAVAIDLVFGEPKRWHPLVGFGRYSQWIANMLNKEARQNQAMHRLTGVFAVMLAVLPFVLLSMVIHQLATPSPLSDAPWTTILVAPILDITLLSFALGQNSLHQHALAVLNACQQHHDEKAIEAASMMVSRDKASIEPISATIESVLENGNDSVFGALFWFFVAGGTGALAYRLMNTLDAMWGYKSPRYFYFGWAAARLDDVLNWIPARLTALTYCLLGHTRIGFRCWWSQGHHWKSPNAGPVMAAGAGALRIRLGGPAQYHGEWQQRPDLGEGNPPVAADISRALGLVRQGVYRWLMIGLLVQATF